MTTSFPALLAAALLTAAAAPALAGPPSGVGPLTSFATDEQDCWEVNTSRRADLAAVSAALPEGWQPVQVSTTGTASTLFVDYTCEQRRVDDGPARRTTTSWLTAPARRTSPDGTVETRYWTLWHATDDPLMVEHLRRLGVTSRYVPRSEAALTTDGTTVTFTQHYVDDRPGPAVAYTRSGTAPEPSAQRTHGPGGVFWWQGSRGTVRTAFTNDTSPTNTAMLSEHFEEDSLPRAVYGIADVGPLKNPAFRFTRGSWTSSTELLADDR